PQVAVAVRAGTADLADSEVSRKPQTTDATVVIGRLDAVGHAGLEIFAEVAGAARVAFSVDECELGINLLPAPMAVHAHADVRRRHGARPADWVTIDRDRALH